MIYKYYDLQMMDVPYCRYDDVAAVMTVLQHLWWYYGNYDGVAMI